MYISIHVDYPLYLILMRLEFSRQVLEKSSNIKYHENRPVGAELFHVDRQMDVWTDWHGHYEANNCFLQFYGDL